MYPRGRPRGQGRPQGFHLWYTTVLKENNEMLARGIGSIDESRFQEKVFQCDKEKKSYNAI